MPLKLSMLHEEAPEGIGLRNAKNLGQKITKAMAGSIGLRSINKRSKLRGPKARYRTYPKKSRFNTQPTPIKPRHRKFFGIHKPQITGA